MTCMLELLPEINKPQDCGFKTNCSVETMQKAADLLREARVSAQKISKECGVSRYTITKWGKGHVEVFNKTVGWSVSDICAYRRNYTKRLIGSDRTHDLMVMQEACKLFSEHMLSVREIAAELGLPVSTVAHWHAGNIERFNKATGWKND